MGFTLPTRSSFRAEFAARIVSVVSGGVLILALSRILGPESYGLLFLAISILGTFQILSKLGISKAAGRYISEYKERSQSQVPHIIKTSATYLLITTLFTSVVVIMFSNAIGQILNEPGITPLLLIGVSYLVFSTVLKFLRRVFQGFEIVEKSALIYMIDRLVRLIIAVGLVTLGFGSIGGLIGYIAGSFVACIVGIFYLRKVYNQYPYGSIEEGLRRRIAEYMIPLTATNTANVLEHRVDTILVGYFLNPTAVGYYVLGEQIIQFIRTPADALGFSISPTLSAMKSTGDISKASKIYEDSFINSLLLYLPACLGLFILSEDMVILVFGLEYSGAIIVLQIFSMYMVFQAISMITSNALDYLGRARIRALIKTATSILNVIANIILIPRYGVAGAAVATLLTYCLHTIANVIIMYFELRFNIVKLSNSVFKILIVCSIMYYPVSYSSDYINSIISLFSVCAIGLSIWYVSSKLFGLIE